MKIFRFFAFCLLLAPGLATAQTVTMTKACREFVRGKSAAQTACLAANMASQRTQDYLQGIAHLAVKGDMFDPEKGVALLKSAAGNDGFPNADYILGATLISGNIIRRDYDLAFKYIARAAQQKNYLATDLLAAFYIEGLGPVNVDIDKAIELYRLAGGNGISLSYIKLAKLYLDGRRIPANEALALDYLKIAEKAGNAGATQSIQSIKNSKKITNIQVIPGKPGEPPRVVHFNGRNGPLLPYSVGFDDAFQKIFYRPDGESREIVTRLEARPDKLTPPYQFELARRLFMLDEPRAFDVFLQAMTQASYDANRCTDKTAAQGVVMWRMVLVKYIPGWMKLDAGKTREWLARALESVTINDDEDASWICFHGMGASMSAMHGKPYENWLRPRQEWPAIKAQVLEKARKSAAKLRAENSREGS
jgi:hypothetical protein